MANVNKYRSRIKIYKRSYISNGFGGQTESNVLVDTVWAGINQVINQTATNEDIRYKQVWPKPQYSIKIRYRPDINNDFKIFYNNKYFDILAVIDKDNRHDELEIICEVTPSGI